MFGLIFEAAEAVVKTTVRTTATVAKTIVEAPVVIAERSISLAETTAEEVKKAMDKIF